MIHGPNVRKLICHKIALIAIPPGTKDGLAAGIKAITTPGALLAAAKEAAGWVEQAILLVRQAADPNPWRDADDESIAEEILKGIEAKKRKKSGS